MDMNTEIELFERTSDDVNQYLIAECNKYQDGIRVAQFSRSPFVFPIEWTDEMIIESIRNNEYAKYF